jgi:phenylalanyl-tRNA synthetase beta subunit
VWVPEETTEEYARAVVRAHAPETLVRCDCFDTFAKDGRVSYAWHLVFQSKERTLVDEEVQTGMEKIYTALREKGWEVR